MHSQLEAASGRGKRMNNEHHPLRVTRPYQIRPMWQFGLPPSSGWVCLWHLHHPSLAAYNSNSTSAYLAIWTAFDAASSRPSYA